MPKDWTFLGCWSAQSAFLTHNLPSHAQHLRGERLIARAILGLLRYMKAEAAFCAVSSVVFAFFFAFVAFLLLCASCVSWKPCRWAVATATIICNLEAEGAPGKPWPVSWVLGNVLQVAWLSNTPMLWQGKARSSPHETQRRLIRLWETAVSVRCWWILYRKGLLSPGCAFSPVFSITAVSEFAISVT